jgi:hypothetical protein
MKIGLDSTLHAPTIPIKKVGFTGLHGVISRKTAISVRTSNPKSHVVFSTTVVGGGQWPPDYAREIRSDIWRDICQ